MAKVKISIRIEENLLNDAKMKAEIENITLTDLIETAVSKHINSELYIDNQLIASLEKIQQKLNFIENEQSLFEELFIHYLTFYFSLNELKLDDLDATLSLEKDKISAEEYNEIRSKRIDEYFKVGTKRLNNNFMRSFKVSKHRIKSLLEIAGADYLSEAKQES